MSGVSGVSSGVSSKRGAQDIALAQLREFGIPPQLAKRVADPLLRKLAALGYYLQQYASDGWFLSSRDAARLLGLDDHHVAYNMLLQLEADGVFHCTRRGTPGVVRGGKATEYRFVESVAGFDPANGDGPYRERR
jgi:hypothetical protein